MFRDFLNNLIGNKNEKNYFIVSKRVFQYLRDQGCLSADDDRERQLTSLLLKSKNYKKTIIIFLFQTEDKEILNVLFFKDEEMKNLYKKSF